MTLAKAMIPRAGEVIVVVWIPVVPAPTMHCDATPAPILNQQARKNIKELDHVTSRYGYNLSRGNESAQLHITGTQYTEVKSYIYGRNPPAPLISNKIKDPLQIIYVA